MADEDYFDDVPEAKALGGIFAGDGLSEYNQVRTELKRDGLWIHARCEPSNGSCGRRQSKVLIEWYPLMCCAKGFPALSEGYTYDEQNRVIRSPYRCGCGAPFPFGITPQECQAALKRAEQYVYLTPQQLAQLNQRATAELAAIQQRMAPR